MKILEMKNICKSFSGIPVLKNVDLTVNTGEVHALLGENGAGKSTLMNILTGVHSKDKGTITFDGKQIQGMRPQDVVKLGMARTFQNNKVFTKLRVIENIMVGSHIHTDYNLLDAIFRTKRFRDQEREKCATALAFLEKMNFADRADTYAGSLPYGDLRRLEILRAMASGAKLLLLDEPAAGMNPQESAQLVDFIGKIAKEDGYTVILIEHDMNVVMNVADRIYVVDYGKVIAEGLPEEIRTNPEVIRAYLGGKMKS